MATSVQAMAQSLKNLASASSYALRKQTEEPVFEIIKWALGFRQCALRVLKKVTEKWNLVCLDWNVKHMAVLCSKKR